MNKRHWHHLWTRLRFIRPWYFLVLAVVSAVICVFALRANNQQMIELREAVYTADKNNTDVGGALKILQAYITTHMNTNLSAGPNAVYPPIQLKYTYERQLKAKTDEAAQANVQLYTAAQAHCEALNSTDFSGRNRVPCIEQYIQEHTAQKITIPDDLYKFSFVSPKWSPDLAGWSMVLTVLSSLLFIITFAADRWFRRHVA